jgi:hypothetical protein
MTCLSAVFLQTVQHDLLERTVVLLLNNHACDSAETRRAVEEVCHMRGYVGFLEQKATQTAARCGAATDRRVGGFGRNI